MRILIVLTLSILSIFGSKNVLTEEICPIKNNIQSLECFIDQLLHDFDIPGLSIAIIEDSKIVYSKGFGSVKKEKSPLVNQDTQFKIASVSKPLTSLMIAKCIDEEKLSWNTPVKQIYSGFKHQNPELEISITMEDLLSMGLLPPRYFCSIINYQDMNSFKIIERTDPISQKRQKYLYNNAQFDIAGRVVGHLYYPDMALLASYKRLMQEKVFTPLKMYRSGFEVHENFAFPHTLSLEGQTIPITFEDDIAPDIQAPAGGVWSTVSDLSQYILLELEGDESYISNKNLFKRRTVYTPILDPFYGLGLRLEKDNGLQRIGHSGTTAGFSSLLIFYPEKKCGVVILCNASQASTLKILALLADKIFEHWFNVDKTTQQRYELTKENFRKRKVNGLEKLVNDDAFLEQYLGAFENEYLGKIEIKREESCFVLKAPTLKTSIVCSFYKGNQKVLRLTDAPVIDEMLYPLSKDQLMLKDGVYEYVFSRIS